MAGPLGFEPRISGSAGQKEPPAGSIHLQQPIIDWKDPRIQAGFAEYVKRYDLATAQTLVRYLDRYVTALESPIDVMTLFSPLTIGQQHHLNRALRALFNFCEIMGFDRAWLDGLRKAIPKDQIGIDLKVPEEEDIFHSIQLISEMTVKYRALWDLCLDSGIRMIEAVRIINDLDLGKLQQIGDVCLYATSSFRGSKQAYYAFFTPQTLKLIQGTEEKIDRPDASHYYWKMGIVRPKYLRKFAFDTMTSEKINIPESVADFIEGRVPRTVGARHYMKLKRQAVQFYPRYAEYLATLRSKASLSSIEGEISQ